MLRHTMIETIGAEYLTSNIEAGEYSYVQAAGNRTLLESKVGHPITHFKLDLRFESEDIVILIETKQVFVDSDEAQLQEYLEEEKALNPTKKTICILANTTNDKIRVWKSYIDSEHLLSNEQVLDKMEHYAHLFRISKSNDRETVLKNTYSSAGYVPDWDFMEHYIKSLHYKPLTTSHSSSVTSTLSTADWKEFTLDAVFILKGGFYNKKPEHSSEGTIPFLASTESHNGVTEFYSLEDIESWDKVGNEDNTLDKKLYDGNCIAVTVNGSVCNAFYQRERFTCSHDITAFYLRSHEMTPHLAMFLCTIITKDKYRWSYGRKPHDVKKFGQSIIRLPVQHNSNGTILFDESHTYSSKGYIPDWAFMENYIKSLPYGDRL